MLTSFLWQKAMLKDAKPAALTWSPSHAPTRVHLRSPESLGGSQSLAAAANALSMVHLGSVPTFAPTKLPTAMPTPVPSLAPSPAAFSKPKIVTHSHSGTPAPTPHFAHGSWCEKHARSSLCTFGEAKGSTQLPRAQSPHSVKKNFTCPAVPSKIKGHSDLS